MDNRINKSYLYWYFQNCDWEQAAGSSDKIKGKTLNKKKLQELAVLLPPLDEQRRIVEVLDKAFEGLDRARANVEANLGDTERLLSNSFRRIFDPDIHQFKMASIGSFAKVFDGPHATPKTIDEGPIFLNISALQNGNLVLSNTRHVKKDDYTKWTKRVTPQPGDVVFSYETRLGQAALIPSGLTCCLGRRMGLVRTDNSIMNPRFFVLYYVSSWFKSFIDANTVRGTTVDRISIREFPSFLFPVPPLDEQDKLVEKAEFVANALIDVEKIYQAKLADLNTVRQTLLAKAFVGELT